jgi:protein TonB
MKIIVCSILALFLTGTLLAQDSTSKADDGQIFTREEQPAQFVGGDSAWKRYLSDNLNTSIPIKNDAPEDTYTVEVQFIVKKDGSIVDVKADTHWGYGMEEEAIRLIKNSPNWIPAHQNHRPVNAYTIAQINFVVGSN